MEEGWTAFGGVAMQETRYRPEKERMSEVAQVIVGVVLFILLTGFWAYLWVPPPPIF